MFSSRSFIVSGLTFKSVVHFEFTFVYGVRLNIGRKLHTVLHSGCTYLYSSQRYGRVPLSSCPLQNLLFVDFFIMAVFMGVR